MPATSQTLGHYDEALSSMSVAYMQSDTGFIHDKVFPVVPVTEGQGVYWTIPRGNFFRDDVQVRPMGGRAPVTTFGATTAQYICEEEGLAAAIDDRERANNTNPMSSERSKVRLLTAQHLIHADRKWATAFFGTGLWGLDVTGVAAAPSSTQHIYWNLSTSTPIQDLASRSLYMKRTTGVRPNRLVLGAETYIALCNNDDILDRIKHTQRGVVTTDLLASLFDVEKVLVADATYNSAPEGGTESMSLIADSKSALLCYAAPEPALEVPSAGYTIAWTGLLGGAAFGKTAAVRRWRDDPAHSDFFEVSMAHQQKLVASDLGIFFSAIVQ